MRRLNVKFILALMVFFVVSVVGIFFLHRWQVDRNAGSLFTRAREALDAGRKSEALELLSRYVGMRPEDTDAYAEFSKLLLERAASPGAVRRDISRAYATLEAAVRKDPENELIRQRLAQFQLAIRRPGDAREHLLFLKERRKLTDAMAAGRDDGGGENTGDEPAGEKDDPDRLLTATEIDMLLARSLAGTGRYDEAAAVLAELLGYDRASREFLDGVSPPDDAVGAYVLLAALFTEELRAEDEAATVLERLVEVSGDDPRAWLALRSWHLDQNDREAAARDVAKALELAPDDLDCLLAEFDLKKDEEDFSDAAAAIRRAKELFPDDERVVRGLAIAALRLNKPEKAVEVLREGIEKNPGQAGLLLLLADTLFQQRAFDELDGVLESLRGTLGDQSPAVRLLEARLLIVRRKWLDAKRRLEDLRPMVVASPGLTRQIDLLLGQCYEQLGQYDQQLEANQRVLSGSPESVAARVGTAAALAASGRWQEALSEYELVASTLPPDDLPKYPQIWNPLLQLRIRDQVQRPAEERGWARVEELLERLAASEDVSDSQLAILRADLLVRQEKTDEAIENLAAAVRAAPQEGGLLGAYATLLMRFREPEEALAAISAAPEEVRNEPATLLIEGRIACREPGEEATEALQKLEARAASLEPTSRQRVLAGIAGLYGQIGKRGDARRIWTSLAEEDPGNIVARSALFDLARVEGDLEKVQEAARGIAEAAGESSGEARLAEAASLILEVQLEQQKQSDESAASDAGLTDSQRQKLAQARSELIEAENSREGWAEVQQRLAEIDRIEGDIPSAITRLERALQLSPGNVQVVRQLVALLYTSGRVEEAEQALAMLSPDQTAGLDRISAELQLREGKLDEAVALAERTVAADSDNPDELMWLGQLLARSEQRERARDTFRRVTELAPERPEPWLALVSLEVAGDDRAAAERTLEQAVKGLEPPTDDLVAAQGAEILGEFGEAEKRFRKAVQAAPGNPLAARGLAGFLVRRGKLSDARKPLESLLAIEGDDTAAMTARIWARRTLAEIVAGNGSYKDLREALELIKANSEAAGGLTAEDLALQVQLLARRQEPESWRAAIDRLDELGEMRPLSVSQRLLKAELLEKVGRWGDARSEMFSLVGATDAPLALYVALIEKLIEHGETATARTWLARLRERAPDAPPTLALAARLAVAEGDRQAAAAAAKQLMPKEKVPDDQLGQLRSIAGLMEELGFDKAADKLLGELAARSAAGGLVYAEFLGRQGRTAEALDRLEEAWETAALERVMQTCLTIARAEGTPISPQTAARLDGYFTKAKRIDPGSVVIQLLEAELRDLENRPDEVRAIYRGLLAREDLADSQRAIVANNLAFHLADPATADEAEALIEQAILQLGPHPDLLDTRGIVRLAKGQTSESLEDFEEAVLIPTAAKYLHLAAAQVQAEQLAAARRSLERAKQLGLDPSQLSTADRERLQAVQAAIGETAGA